MSQSIIVLTLLSLLAGALIPLQAGANRVVSQAVGDPLLAAGVSFIVGSAVLLALGLGVLRRSVPGDFWSAVPTWAWSGGLMGAVFVTAAIVLTPRLGTTTYLLMVFVGQLTMALLVDHFGLVGFARRQITAMQIAGLATVLIGAALALGSFATRAPD